MGGAIALITLGGIFVYSGIKGLSITDVLSGVVGTPLNPAGGRGGNVGATGADTGQDESTAAGIPATISGGTGQFKGPHATQLNNLSKVATAQFHLRISQICRPANANYGAPNSLHKSCRAFDSTGSVANRVAFARYVKANCPWVDEVFCDQAGMVAPGYDHSDHVHVGA